ncbi:polar growth protein [Mycoblastus sanguinarius]|nr:polar growth protein [Mycoblastus sanguinarius]
MATAASLLSGNKTNLHTLGSTRPDEPKRGAAPVPMQGSAEPINADGATPPPLNTTPPSQKTISVPHASLGAQTLAASTPAQRSISMIQQEPDEDSPVMNETLSVIDEHITDMHGPRTNITRAGERRLTNDSGSEYSTHLDHRLSYITGHETDEEERNIHTEKEVMSWSPGQVAECLEDIGVESRHCEIFKEQEITGEVLLAMDQASIFMKEFDLGLVGRRLRTWHKIKALQEEIRGPGTPPNKRQTTFDGDAEVFDPGHTGNGAIRRSTVSSTLYSQPNPSYLYPRQDVPSPQPSPSAMMLQSQRQDANSTPASFTFKSGLDSPSRPSAASIREFNHSRRHSAVDFASTFSPSTPVEQNPPSTPNRPTAASPHKKAPSLDRNWTMGGPHPMTNGRPLSATQTTLFSRTDRNTFDPHSQESNYFPPASRDFDRGYVSGGEAESKRSRNVLRKRDVVSANHSRQSSYQAETKRMSFAGARRHSRFGSVDSIKDTVAAMASPAAKMYHGSNIMGHFRNSSANEALMPTPPSNDLTSPTVTKLEYDKKPSMKVITTSSNSKSTNNSPKSGVAPSKSFSKPRMGLRAISDAVTGHERAFASSPASVPSPIKESAVQSPTRTGSTTPSGASQSIELESTDASSKGTGGPHTGLTPTSGTRRKSKKETSAYTRGLEQKSPQEQMEGCDYSGWMKKKSSNIMTTWKPRLFVLRGRRLSYYYSDTDTQEKGLIDISSHRVLPADHDLFTGFHATVTGAKSSPVSPTTAHTPTLASKEAAAQPESTLQKSTSASMFIFKLVPPRTGLSRAVNFTKPTVHYFAVDNVTQGRLWMAALMKATIDRDETKPITTTYQQKTISLVKARAMRHRPPALMGLDEKTEGFEDAAKSDETGLNIQGLDFDKRGAGSEHKRTGSLDDPPSTVLHEENIRG